MNKIIDTLARLFVIICSAMLLTHCAMWQTSSAPAAQTSTPAVAQPTHTPKQIALLLPLHGSTGAAGNAIKNGFLAAYYAGAKAQPNGPRLKIYDTSTGNVVQIYQQAIQEGADFVVGPLLKNNVQQIMNANVATVPTLALNTLPGAIDSRNVMQFGLSPFDEAQQAADRAWAHGARTAVVLVSNPAWGQSIADVFERTFTQHGGRIITQLTLSPDNTAPQLKRFFDLNSARDEKLPGFVPKKRQDVDVIYLIAQLPAAIQIIPLLRYYYAGDIPLYALSQLYPAMGVDQPNMDLNNTYFCDMPWVLDPSNEPQNLQNLRLQIETIWPDSFSNNKKLYALGIDAYTIATQALPITGATGNLSLDTHHHIYRQLRWAQFQNGLPVLVPS